MELPVVNHEDYFAKIGDDHKFPIQKFGALANYLTTKKIVKKFHTPYPCSDLTLKRAHSENYIKNVRNKTLDQNTIKKIAKIKPKLSTTGGTSDLRFIKAISPGLEFGLVGRTMHRVDEAVSLKDLKNLTKIYENILQYYFK